MLLEHKLGMLEFLLVQKNNKLEKQVNSTNDNFVFLKILFILILNIVKMEYEINK
jgi:hypothetical protein